MNWDDTLLYKALQIIRCDPSSATGFAPAQLLLGRELFYPMDFDTRDVDFTGTKLTKSVVNALNKIHDDNFGTATKNIEKHQARYKKYYDKKNRVKKLEYKVGAKVQLKKGNYALKRKTDLKWKPRAGFYEVIEVNAAHQTVKLKNPENGYVMSKSKPYSSLRTFKPYN